MKRDMRSVRPGLLFLITVCIAITPHDLFAQGIRFERGLSWEQIKEKAKTERKYIFVDCFASWCGPCKLMDQQVYPDTALGEFINAQFISVKVQMDSTKNDDTNVRAWRADTRRMMTDDKVAVFPTLLFFSPGGKLLHKAVGYMPPMRFLRQAINATDPDKQEYALLDKFRNGELAVYSMPSLILLLEDAGDKESANEVAQYYVHTYLLKLPDELLFKKENIRLIGAHLKSVDNAGFELFYKRSKKLDSIAGKDYAEDVIGNVILKTMIYPQLWRDAEFQEPVTQRPDWQNISDGIQYKYGQVYVDLTMPFAKALFYRKTKQWPELVGLEMKQIENEDLDSSGHLLLSAMKKVNDLIYDPIFMHGVDKNILKKAAGWQKTIIENNPGDQADLDTYANLLYKIGSKRKKAISLETKAMQIEEEQAGKRQAAPNPEFKQTVEKMKASLPTWDAEQ